MEQKRLYLTAVLLIVVLGNTFAFSGKGNGTQNSPYLVSNADELFEIRGDLKAYYRLTQDIDVSEWIADNNPQQGWMPIGSVQEPFMGTIDGDGFSVVNLMCNRPSANYVGFVGYLKGTLCNISFVNPLIIGGQYVGIVGYLYADNKMENVVAVGGQIKGDSNIGGMVGSTFYYFSYGDHYGTVLNCYCSADVSATGDNVGGICGYLDKYGRILHCAFDGKISGNDCVGGIVGRILEISYCMYNITAGTLNGKKSHVGGIEGYWEGKTYTGDYGVKGNVAVQDTISSIEATPWRIGENISENSNYAYSKTIVITNGRVYSSVEDNMNNGSSFGLKILQKQTTYDGLGFDFNNYWTIMEGKTFPYNIHQSAPCQNLSFVSGSRGRISGTSSGKTGTVYIIINHVLYQSYIVDGKWEMTLGNVKEGQLAYVSLEADGKMPSILVKGYAEAETQHDEKTMTGDANGDGVVDTADVTAIINYILGKPSASFNKDNADVTGDGEILIDDAVQTVQLIMNAQ